MEAAVDMEIARARWTALEAGNPSAAERKTCVTELRWAEKAWLRAVAPQLGAQQLENFTRNYEKRRLRGETPPEYDISTGHTAKRTKNTMQQEKHRQARKPYRWHPTYGFIQFKELCQVHVDETETQVLRRWLALSTVKECSCTVREDAM